MLLIGWKYAASNQKHYPDPVVTRISMEFLRVFLSRLFAGKPVVASPNVGCFLRQVPQVHYGLLFCSLCSYRVKQNSIQFLFGFRLKGLLCEGSQESPILHLRLVEPHETFEEDEEKLKEVVALVSCLCCLSHLFVNGKCSL